ncbi:hypothetical protein [Roseomonas elaeocarpi]|uniref:Uncharacterized protein n=1 Tax=Roseomonas elaeocarpi TaxID=907779 RepID=A0ABV6JVV7_9PROT
MSRSGWDRAMSRVRADVSANMQDFSHLDGSDPGAVGASQSVEHEASDSSKTATARSWDRAAAQATGRKPVPGR